MNAKGSGARSWPWLQPPRRRYIILGCLVHAHGLESLPSRPRNSQVLVQPQHLAPLPHSHNEQVPAWSHMVHATGSIMGRRPLAQPRLAAVQLVGRLTCSYTDPATSGSFPDDCTPSGELRKGARQSTEGQPGDAVRALIVSSKSFGACTHEGSVDWTRLRSSRGWTDSEEGCLVSRSCLDPCSLGVVHRARDPGRPVHVAQRPPCIGGSCQRGACSGLAAWRR